MPDAIALTAAKSVPSIPVEICSKMVETAYHSCPIAISPATASPHWEALATSLSSLSTAIAWGAIVIAIILFVAGLAWGKVVTAAAEKEAREEAKRCAERWLTEEAPKIVRQYVENISGATLAGNDAKAADELGEQAG